MNKWLASFVVSGSLAACNKPATPPIAVTPVAPVAAPTPGAAVPAAASALPAGATAAYAVGQKTRCPVTGEEFVVSATTKQSELDGKHYAFCCADCQPSFEKEPAKYTKKN